MRGVLTLMEVKASQRPVAVQNAGSFRTLAVSRMMILAAPDNHVVVRFSSFHNSDRFRSDLATREEDQAEARAGEEADSATREVRAAAGKGMGCGAPRTRRVVVLLPMLIVELAAELGRLSRNNTGKVQVLDLDEARAVATSRRRQIRLVACTEPAVGEVCVARPCEGSEAIGITGRGGSR